jgi:hypothetical protein
MEDRLTIFRRSESEIVKQLAAHQYPKAILDDPSFLLGIPMRQFTKENLETLVRKIERLEAELVALEATTLTNMWRGELDRLTKEYAKVMAEMAAKKK